MGLREMFVLSVLRDARLSLPRSPRKGDSRRAPSRLFAMLGLRAGSRPAKTNISLRRGGGKLKISLYFFSYLLLFSFSVLLVIRLWYMLIIHPRNQMYVEMIRNALADDFQLYVIAS